eukprot:CAMPEP_0119413896 /NCGR_PEP_ID=MMETSP1335-20130426/6193_1 /TAXON_ID=259385 /ORGANISM="Chrysoculter rhomboideus, Strain RCC1486" /LENGTH=160 /DNA_ID=CAMNT_0007438727 /DNA_START=23 /DNA_END=505 /DNA_ORIENTATION=+
MVIRLLPLLISSASATIPTKIWYGCDRSTKECWTTCFRCSGTSATGAIKMPWEEALSRLGFAGGAARLGIDEDRQNLCWCSNGMSCTKNEECESHAFLLCKGPCLNDNSIHYMESFLALWDFTINVFIYPFIACTLFVRCCCGVPGLEARIRALENRRIH